MGRTGYGGGGRMTRMTSALRWAAMRAILMFHNCEGQSHKTESTDHYLNERRAEADLNWGPSAYQPTALPLGQTGSQASSGVDPVIILLICIYGYLCIACFSSIVMRFESLKAFCKFLIIISFYCYYYLFSRSFGKCCERLIMAESGDASARTGEISDLENRIIRQVEVRITKELKRN